MLSPRMTKGALTLSLLLAVACSSPADVSPIPDLGDPEPVSLDVRWDRIVACLAGLGYDAEVTDDGVGMITDPLPPEEVPARDVAIRACEERYPQGPLEQGPAAPESTDAPSEREPTDGESEPTGS
jgi:hypothetical protein